jgi:cytochrome c oxidase assembly factor CtaG
MLSILPHPGQPPAPHDLWGAWNWSPLILAALLLAGLLYGRGVRLLWRRAGRGRGVRGWQAWAYAGGLLALFVALISPLDALAEALFAAHMAQHMLLTLAAAPLLVLGAPLVPLLWALKGDRRQATGDRRQAKGERASRSSIRVLSSLLHRSPLVLPLALALHVALLWLWHAPALYEAALWSEVVHVTEHISLLGSALLFWWAAGIARYGRRAGVGGVLAMFGMAAQSSLLGALLLAARTPWYQGHAASLRAWGLTPLGDQQGAALIMMLPCDVVYVLAAVALCARWLHAAEQRARQSDARALGALRRAETQG